MRQSRAVVLGTNGYPYLMAYWKHLFETVWQDEVDKVHIAVSTPLHQSAWGYTSKMLSNHPKIEVILTGDDWPASITTVLKRVEEASVMIPHDDMFVFEKGVIDKYFSLVEEQGLVVTPIHDNYTPAPLVNELMQRKWGDRLPLVEDETGRTGYAFFCNFFFVSMKLLKQTSMDFGGHLVKQGDRSDLLDWTPLTQNIHADTNFKLGLELLEAGAKFSCPREVAFAQQVHIAESLIPRLMELLGESDSIFTSPYLHMQTFSYHLGGLLPDLGFYEAIEEIRGSRCPRAFENIPKSVSARNDAMIKIATIQVFMDMFSWSAISDYHEYTIKEFEQIRKYFKIEKTQLSVLKSLIARLLIRKP